MPKLSPVADNCPTWISSRDRMAVKIISWPNLYERYAARPEDPTRNLLNTSLTAHPTDLAKMPLYQNISEKKNFEISLTHFMTYCYINCLSWILNMPLKRKRMRYLGYNCNFQLQCLLLLCVVLPKISISPRKTWLQAKCYCCVVSWHWSCITLHSVW